MLESAREQTRLTAQLARLTAEQKTGDGQLRREVPKLKPGQRVELHVVALGLELRGRVESLAFGSEARLKHTPGGFATYDAEVPQRVPVRVAIEPGQRGSERVRPGMTVETRVRLR